MNICIPTTDDEGLESKVCAHFGSAPAFLVVDTDSGGTRDRPGDGGHPGGRHAPGHAA
jgi:predicted Fe-Mo cluster-binding NifX family protein